VILPRENEHDLDDLPPETHEEVEFTLVDGIEEVLEHAFAAGSGRSPQRRASPVRQAASPR
jgi:ATP-dependent Lon protease